MTAVLQGLDRGGFSPSDLRDLHYFIEHENNYESYRKVMDGSPALHFLFPVIRDIRHRKNLTLFLLAVDTSSSYRLSCSKEWVSSVCESILGILSKICA